MPRVFDNIDQSLKPALCNSLKQASRADFSVGYFNLRGWQNLSHYIEPWSGSDGNCARVLVGMHMSPREELAKALSISGDDQTLDNQLRYDGQEMELGTYAVTCSEDLLEEEIAPGVLFCLRSENAEFGTAAEYALAPYYLVFVSDAGEVRLNFTQAKKILDLLKKISIGHSDPEHSAIQRFDKITDHGANMTHYQELLVKAISAVTGKAEERGVESLFQRGGTALSSASFRGIDDFEVVTYLVILNC